MAHFYESIEFRSSEEDEAFPTALPSLRQYKPPLPPPKIRRRTAMKRKIHRPHSYACGSTGWDSIKPRVQPRKSLEILPKPSPIEVLSSPMSIQELVDEHQKDFPVKVEVNSGMYGEIDVHTFSASDRLNIHFIKKVKMAVIEHYGGKVVKVPLNSDLQLGVVYDPDNVIEAALIGYEYRTAGDLMDSIPLPKVVRAQQTYKGSSPNSSVDKGDILAVNEVQYSVVFGGGKSLNCSLLNLNKTHTYKKKKLSERCSGFFTTKPANLKLFLPEIVNHYELPVKAVVFITNHSYRNSPFTDGEVVTITKVVNELTVIATSVLEEGSTVIFESPMFDIPVDIPFMEVQIISSQEDDCEILYEETRTLFENYKTMDKSKTIQIQEESDSYYTALLTEDDSGVELVCPESIYMKAEPKSSATQEQVNSTASKQYEIKDLTSDVAALKTEMNDLEAKHDTSADASLIMETSELTSDVAALKTELNDLETKHHTSADVSLMKETNGFTSDLATLETEMKDLETKHDTSVDVSSIKKTDELTRDEATLKAEVKDLEAKHDTSGDADVPLIKETNELTRDVAALKTEMKDLEANCDTSIDVPSIKERPHVPTTPPAGIVGQSEQELNKERVRSLSCPEVLTLLERLNMSAYREVFEEEQIDGEILMECDDEILSTELKVTSRLHRIKLKKIINGKRSVQELLEESASNSHHKA